MGDVMDSNEGKILFHNEDLGQEEDFTDADIINGIMNEIKEDALAVLHKASKLNNRSVKPQKEKSIVEVSGAPLGLMWIDRLKEIRESLKEARLCLDNFL